MPIILNGTAGVTYPDGVLQTSGTPAPGTAGNVLTSNGTIWTSAAAAGFPTGTRMAFQQTAAPTGWTKDTTAAINDSILRLVTGSVTSGGSVGWSLASVGATTLSISQIPSHDHSGTYNNPVGTGSATGNSFNPSPNRPTTTGSVVAQGGGGSHTHGLAGDCKYYDFIIASKD